MILYNIEHKLHKDEMKQVHRFKVCCVTSENNKVIYTNKGKWSE